MFLVGDKIIYGENGVCTVEKIEPLAMSGAPKDKLYYHLTLHAPGDEPGGGGGAD